MIAPGGAPVDVATTESAGTTVAVDVDGVAAPPRSNGELVFDEPWEGRAFGLVMALADRGALSWEAFRDHLISSIASWEAAHPDARGYRYYACWLDALEDCLADSSLVEQSEVSARVAVLAARPAGHDHRLSGEHYRGGAHGHGH